MTRTCPYCGGEMDERPPEFELTAKQRVVYETILKAGPKGVSVRDLTAKFYIERSPMTLRSCIFNINQVIKPMKIASRDKTYSIQDQI